MKITESQLRKIVREEYVRVLLERSGRRVTESRVRFLAENASPEQLEEIFPGLGAVGSAAAKWAGEKLSGAKAAVGKVKTAAKETYKAGEEKAAKEKAEKEADVAYEKLLKVIQGKLLTSDKMKQIIDLLSNAVETAKGGSGKSSEKKSEDSEAAAA